ncbi:MAG: ATP-binding protein [Acidimicrobiales bacterium]
MDGSVPSGENVALRGRARTGLVLARSSRSAVLEVRHVLRRRSLSAQILALQSAVLVVTLVAGFALVVFYQRGQLDREYERRALAVAQSVAAMPAVQDAVMASDPHGAVETLARTVRLDTHVDYIVITNAKGIRYSHPNPKLIGQPVYDDPEAPSSEPFRTGKVWVGIQTGTLGTTARGKVPLFGPGHRLIGEVSVGIPVAQVTDSLIGELPTIAGYMLAALALGCVLSIALTRRLKRQTLGLELDEIAGLYQEREAMLHGIREGVLGLDTRGRVLLANDEACHLLELTGDFNGRALTELVPPGRLADVITGAVSGADQLLVIEHRVIVANRMPVRGPQRERIGWVVTFHDRTEPEGLLRELDAVVGLTEALRAQSHEFSNRLHTLVGLIELGRYDEAIAFVTDVSTSRNDLTARMLAAFGDPMVVALLLAKTAVAAERGVSLEVATSDRLNGELVDVGDVITVLGNLLDNGVDAACEADGPRWVRVELSCIDGGLVVRVADSGPGVASNDLDNIFVDGWSTKHSKSGARRGLGLALVHQLTERRCGFVDVRNEPGAVFTALLPGCVRTESTEGVMHR